MGSKYGSYFLKITKETRLNSKYGTLILPSSVTAWWALCIAQDVGGENSSSKPEDIENQDESDVEVTEDFDGSMEDVKDESQQGESSDEDEG